MQQGGQTLATCCVQQILPYIVLKCCAVCCIVMFVHLAGPLQSSGPFLVYVYKTCKYGKMFTVGEFEHLCKPKSQARIFIFKYFQINSPLHSWVNVNSIHAQAMKFFQISDDHTHHFSRFFSANGPSVPAVYSLGWQDVAYLWNSVIPLQHVPYRKKKEKNYLIIVIWLLRINFSYIQKHLDIPQN